MSTLSEPRLPHDEAWLTLGSVDADCFDGQHRVRVFTLRDAAGVVIPGTYLMGGEEAANGDYQDYVLVVTNVKPSP